MAQLKLSAQQWSTRTAFILAAVGSAVGLGNLWKFPYIAGENGGGAFVLVYLGCVLLLGLPVLIAEITLGRRGQANPPQSMANLANEAKANRLWWLLGFNGVFAGILILSFYSVIAGWAVSYFFDSLFGNLNQMTPEAAESHFNALISDPAGLMAWHTLVMIVTILIVAKGVRSGIEKAISWMMPGLFLILLVLLGYAMSLDSFAKGALFLFSPDFSKLSWDAVLVAMGQAFFTLSLGMGAMMVYGSYLSKEASIVKSGIWIAVADTMVALLAGLVIFTIVFANDMSPGAGPGLLFQTLPVAFGQMSGGWFFGTLFFALVVLAAFSSAISIVEPALSWFEQNWGWARYKAAMGLGVVIWLLGVGTVLSFNHWSGVHFIGERSFFDSLDFLTTNIMMPLGGLLMSVFLGWVMAKSHRDEELQLPGRLSTTFDLVLRYITPILVLMVFVYNLR